jgi:Pyruvate/2-oxoacid:ferredoxin oxidoreductase delta subunit/biotin operon repressor
MSTDEAHIKLAERSGHADSKLLHRILEKAMTSEEARFLLELPASNADLAAKFKMTEKAVEEKVYGLARRGLVVTSRKGIRFPRDLGTLHDNILASAPEHIPAGIGELWMEFYESGWWKEITGGLTMLPAPALRVILPLKAVPPGVKLLPCESAEEIIRAHKDLISIRRCCCRVGAQTVAGAECKHPIFTCTQFGRRAEYDLYRGSGKKVSADEAIAIHHEATGAGLTPTVTNISVMEGLEFICYCCGDACLVLNPILRADKVAAALSPSRFLPKVDNKPCDGCRDCVPACCYGAIEMKAVPGHKTPVAAIIKEKCVGCGICVLKCRPKAIVMELVKPSEFIPASITGPSSIVHG